MQTLKQVRTAFRQPKFLDALFYRLSTSHRPLSILIQRYLTMPIA